MTTNVNFRVDVQGTAAARSNVKGLKDDLTATSAAAGQSARARRSAEDDINRQRGLSVQAEIRAQRQQAEAGRAALAQRLADFKRNKKEEEREAERSRKEELSKERQHGAALMALHRRQAEAARSFRGGGPGSPSGPKASGNPAEQSGGSGVGSLLAGRALGLGARVLAPLAAAKGIGDSVNAYAQYEKLGVTLEVLFESADKSKKVLSELNTLSLKTGVGVERFAKAATTMNGFGVAADKIVPKLTQIAAITRGDAEKMDRLALAFAQSAGQGRLMAEELNQMIDAGFNPLLQISKDTGLSIVELRKKMKDGKLDFDLLSDAMDHLVQAGGKYEHMMDSMEKTTSVKIAKMSLAFTNLYRAAGKALASDESKLGNATGAVTGGTASTVNYLSEGITQLTATPNARQAAFEASWARTAQENPELGKNGRMGTDGISGMRERARLDALINAGNEKRAKAAEDEARAIKKSKDEEAAALKANLTGQAVQLRNAYQLAKIQQDAAKDQIDAQKKILETTKKQVAEAQKNLTSGVKGFAAMSKEDKQSALKVLQKARSGQQLTFDEAEKLEGIGSREAKTLAERNRNRLANGVGFDALGQQALDQRLAPIDEQLDLAKGKRAQLAAQGRTNYDSVRGPDGKLVSVPSMFGEAKTYTKKQKEQLAGYDSKISDLEIQKQEAAKQVQGAVQADKDLYGNVFGNDQQALRQGMQKAQQITANIKQTIEFKAYFEASAKQIAAEVEQKFLQANDEQTKEVIKLLKPVMEKIKTDRMNAASRAGMAGSK